MKYSTADRIVMAIFGVITCFISSGITVSYIKDSPLSVALYLFYLLLSGVIIAGCIRKADNPNKEALICSVFNAVIACAALELIYRIMFDTDIPAEIIGFAAANIASSFFISRFFVFVLNHSEATDIHSIKNNVQQTVYEQINAEYIRLSSIIKFLNSFRRMLDNETRRYDYISLFPGANKAAYENARSNAFSTLLKNLPKSEQRQINSVGFSEYYKQINSQLAAVRNSKSDFDRINSTQEYKMFLDKYSFIKV